MSGSFGTLDIQCPASGRFYVCQDRASRFMGCCTVNPCLIDSGICPDANLETTSFNSSEYNSIKEQGCVADGKWYTCGAITPTFMGCCALNPCKPGGCPQDMIRPARLSNITLNAAPLLTTTSTSTANGRGARDKSQGLGGGAIAGIVVGVVAIMALIGLGVFFFLRRRRSHLGAAIVEGSEDAGQDMHHQGGLGYPTSTESKTAFAESQISPMSNKHSSHNNMSVVSELATSWPPSPGDHARYSDVSGLSAHTAGQTYPYHPPQPLFEMEEPARYTAPVEMGGGDYEMVRR